MEQQTQSGWEHWPKSPKLWYFYLLISRNFEETEIFTLPVIKEISLPQFYGCSGLETKTSFLTMTAVASILTFACYFPQAQIPTVWCMNIQVTPAPTVGCIREE